MSGSGISSATSTSPLPETDGEVGYLWREGSTDPAADRRRAGRSGRETATPLIFGRDGESLVLVASQGGAPTHPDWYRNLVETPEWGSRSGDRFPARARTAEGEERDRLWRMMNRIWRHYDAYQAKTTARSRSSCSSASAPRQPPGTCSESPRPGGSDRGTTTGFSERFADPLDLDRDDVAVAKRDTRVACPSDAGRVLIRPGHKTETNHERTEDTGRPRGPHSHTPPRAAPARPEPIGQDARNEVGGTKDRRRSRGRPRDLAIDAHDAAQAQRLVARHEPHRLAQHDRTSGPRGDAARTPRQHHRRSPARSRPPRRRRRGPARAAPRPTPPPPARRRPPPPPWPTQTIFAGRCTDGSVRSRGWRGRAGSRSVPSSVGSVSESPSAGTSRLSARSRRSSGTTTGSRSPRSGSSRPCSS